MKTPLIPRRSEVFHGRGPQHSVETYGINFHLPEGTLSCIHDTNILPGVLSQYPGEILVMNVILCRGTIGKSIIFPSLM